MTPGLSLFKNFAPTLRCGYTASHIDAKQRPFTFRLPVGDVATRENVWVAMEAERG